MSALHKAYQVLGLEPGTPFEPIKRRYRRLVLVWHPDRMHNDDGRREAEEELKNINQAFDALRNHFEKHHRLGAACECQQNPSKNDSAHSGKSHQANSAQDEQRRREEEASRREEERRRSAAAAAAEEAARRAEQERRAAEAARQAMQDATKQQHLLQEEQFRWRIAVATGLAVVVLLFFAYIGIAARNGINDLQRKWSQDHLQRVTSPTSPQPAPGITISPAPADDPENPYIPLEYRFPGGNPASWRKFMEEQELQQKKRDEEQRKQDVYFTKLAIDRNQKIIAHCESTIADLEAKIADPYVSEFEKNKLREYRDFQQHNLEAARQELVAAQEKLNQLEQSDLSTPAPSNVVSVGAP